MKNSFVIYTDYMEQIELLSLEQRGVLLTAIMSYASGAELPDMDGMTKMAFSFIRSRMDKDSEKYRQIVEKRREAGKQGGRPKADGLPEKQEKAKKANGFSEKQNNPDNDYVNDNDSVNDKDKKSSMRFAPPTLDELNAYCGEKGLRIDAQRFIDFYESKGWMIGKNQMKDWKAAVRNWSRSQRQELTAKAAAGNKFNNFHQRDYDMAALERQLLTGGDSQ